MKIVFRLNYHTAPGQSLWLKLVTLMKGKKVRFEQLLPLCWLNDRQWQAEINVSCTEPLGMEYSYQFRDDSNGVKLDEWNGPRTAEADPAALGALLLEDTWCSAGTVDYAYETRAFNSLQHAEKRFAKPEIPKGANHTFRLRMAALPKNLTPCLIGNTREIGEWGWHHAVPLQELAANVWSASVHLPTDWHIEYKYGLYDARLGCAVSLECGENRVLEPRVFDARQQTIVQDEGYGRDPSLLYRAAGVAIPVFSLRSEWGLGVGEFADLKTLGNWAAKVGLKLIQILPVNDTTSTQDWTDSYPYSAVSVSALHPLYLRLDDLKYPMPEDFPEEIDSIREWLNELEHVDYEESLKAKHAFARRIFTAHGQTITAGDGFRNFLNENREWVVPYAVFCVKRDHFQTADTSQWSDWRVFDPARVDAMADTSHPDWPQVSYHIWLQFELDQQLSDAVEHLHKLGLALKGDLPIGIDRRSVEAWSSPHLFKPDSQAGAPPDAFAVKGQNWGFPTYNWEAMRTDGYAWWRSRFARLSRYFDAFRIDHILGFFRIWQIPSDQVEGIMGWFDPALPVSIGEFHERGIEFDLNRHCRPYIREHFLWDLFGDLADEAKAEHLECRGDGIYQLRDHVASQRRIVDHFATLEAENNAAKDRLKRLRHALLDCASEVLFLEIPGSNGTLFHPRWSLQLTRSFEDLEWDDKWRIDELYVDYFHRRQEGFWQARGYEKLPAMRRASPMLLCGEDLGVVPACVPGVLRELGILSLEIQRMPKSYDSTFSNPAWAPYLSVVSTSTHDMPTLRSWWGEDQRVTGDFAWRMLGIAFPPTELSGEIASAILRQHLQSPAMWAIFPLQDLMAIDETLRHPDPEAERINVPAIIPHYWRYRMHLGLDELLVADSFNSQIRQLLQTTGRFVTG